MGVIVFLARDEIQTLPTYGETALDAGFYVIFDAAEGAVKLRRHYM